MADPTPEDIDKLVALLRRALKRTATLEQRLAAVEERLEWLEDLPEQVQGLTRLAGRVSQQQKLDDNAIRTIVHNTVDKRLRKLQGGTSPNGG